MPIYFPPLLPPVTGTEASLLIAGQSFARRADMAPLRLPAVQSFLDLGGSSVTVDDADLLIASQVFGR